MRYLVTGATGFIGGRLTRALCDAGHEVNAVVRDPQRASALSALGVHLYRGDITDRESLLEPMSGVDGVFHLAAWYELGSHQRAQAEQINVLGTRNVLEAMRDLRVPRGVYTSSVAVFSDTAGQMVDETHRSGGDWLTLYDYTKWKAHYEVAEPMIRAGLPLVIVQPGVVYGPGDRSVVHRLLTQFLRGKLPIAPQKTAYCFGHVDDVAAAHLLAMEKGRLGESYITAGPLHTFIEVMELASRVSGVPAPKMRPSPRTMRSLASLMRIVGTVLPLPENYRYETLRVIAGVTYGGSSAKAEHELGWKARSLEEGLPPVVRAAMAELGMQPPAQARH